MSKNKSLIEESKKQKNEFQYNQMLEQLSILQYNNFTKKTGILLEINNGLAIKLHKDGTWSLV